MTGNALGFILSTKLKNYFRDLIKKPGRIVLLLVLIAAFALTIIGGNSVRDDPERKVRDISLLCAGLNALLILIFTTTFISGVGNGGSFFKMSDVNFVFTAPISRHRVLFFGLIQQMGVNLFIGAFILFQYTTLRSAFDISIWGLLLLFFAYSLTAFIGQCFGLFVYTFISDSDRKKRLVKTIYTCFVLALVAYLGFNILSAGAANIVPSLSEYANGIFVHIFPVAGWLGAFAGSILQGNILVGLLWLALTVAVFFVFLYFVAKSNRDFYEDVISSAEATQSAVVAAKENAVPEVAPKNIKIGKTGFTKGWGASILFYKHLRENRRSSKFFISPTSLIYAVITIVFGLIMRDDDKPVGQALTVILCFSAYMMIFSLPLGRFNRELFRPYIYLIPESPVKKMLYATLETIPTELLNSALVFIPCSVILHTGPALCIACILVRTSFALLFTGGNIIIERLWTGNLSKVVGVFVYMLVNLLLSAPAVAVGLILPALGFVVVDATLTTLGLIFLCNIPVSLLVFYLCRNMLQYSESAA